MHAWHCMQLIMMLRKTLQLIQSLMCNRGGLRESEKSYRRILRLREFLQL
eukprot:SAG22_NODE_47_length_24699_cov_13.602317_13_plen_50_part_00